MIMPSDKEYKQTKRIIRGKESINPDFKMLADWIDEKYNVRTINIIYDTIDNGKRPRIGICFEFEKEKLKFKVDLCRLAKSDNGKSSSLERGTSS